jgi:hypothetical protein
MQYLLVLFYMSYNARSAHDARDYKVGNREEYVAHDEVQLIVWGVPTSWHALLSLTRTALAVQGMHV